jgi:hypothetical protein
MPLRRMAHARTRWSGHDHAVSPPVAERRNVVVAVRHLRGKSLRRTVYDHLESPGTKTYTEGDVRSMMMATGFEDLVLRHVFSPGDLLLNRPSAGFQSSVYRLTWRLYPRALVNKIGRRWGLFLLSRRGNLEISKVLEQTVETISACHGIQLAKTLQHLNRPRPGSDIW